MTQPDGQTARDISLEDDGVPDLQDGTPGQAWAEDPEFLPPPGERATATTDVGTTAEEQATGESLDGRLDRELPDISADDPEQDLADAPVQLHQDGDGAAGDDSGTNSTADDVLAIGENSAGGLGPEESAMHLID